jgi:hypothetical protein
VVHEVEECGSAFQTSTLRNPTPKLEKRTKREPQSHAQQKRKRYTHSLSFPRNGTASAMES